MLLPSEGKITEAAAELEALHQDLLLVVGPDDEETQQVVRIHKRSARQTTHDTPIMTSEFALSVAGGGLPLWGGFEQFV